MARNAERQRRWKRLDRDRRMLAKYGPEALATDLRGRHGNHAAGPRNARWNSDERRLTEHGYIAVRVKPDHPHAWGPSCLKRFKYAYEHIVVMMARIGRALRDDETVHHRNGDKTDNRGANLELLTRSDHAKHHDELRGRDRLGRFAPSKVSDPAEWPEDLRVREFPAVAS